MGKFFKKPAGVTPGMKTIAACGALFSFLHLAALLLSPVSFARGVAAATLYACSLALFWSAIHANAGRPLSGSFSPDSPAHLVEHGPYRFVRHPLYCSYLLTWLAAPVATGRWPLLLTFVAMASIYVAAAIGEEKKFLRSPLRSSYEGYRSRTGLLFPKLTHLAIASAFSERRNAGFGNSRKSA